MTEVRKRVQSANSSVTKTYTEQIEFWHWGEISALANLAEDARRYCLELILHRKSKLDCNKELQAKFKVNKRWANSIYTEVQGIISNIDENRANHIKIIQGQIKSIKSALKKREKQIKDFAKTEQKQKLSHAKKCKGFSPEKLIIKKACHLWARERQTTQLQDAKFRLHQKKRRLNLLENQLKHLTNTQPSYTLPENSTFVLVGSKDESSGNQSAQFDYVESPDKFVLSIRTPYALEERLGGQRHSQTQIFYRPS